MTDPLAGRAKKNHIRFAGAATILSFDHSMFTSLDSIGSAVGKRPIGHAKLQLVSGLLNIDRRESPNRSGMQNVSKRTQHVRSSCQKTKAESS